MSNLLILFILLFGPSLIVLGLVLIQRKITEPTKAFHLSIAMIVGLNIAYFMWESQAQGNIRIDLLIIYPCLFLGYNLLLWKKLSWKSIIVATLLIAIDFWYMTKSYRWFHKNLG